jgi:hypothetical protein
MPGGSSAASNPLATPSSRNAGAARSPRSSKKQGSGDSANAQTPSASHSGAYARSRGVIRKGGSLAKHAQLLFADASAAVPQEALWLETRPLRDWAFVEPRDGTGFTGGTSFKLPLADVVRFFGSPPVFFCCCVFCCWVLVLAACCDPSSPPVVPVVLAFPHVAPFPFCATHTLLFACHHTEQTDCAAGGHAH